MSLKSKYKPNPQRNQVPRRISLEHLVLIYRVMAGSKDAGEQDQVSQEDMEGLIFVEGFEALRFVNTSKVQVFEEDPSWTT